MLKVFGVRPKVCMINVCVISGFFCDAVFTRVELAGYIKALSRVFFFIPVGDPPPPPGFTATEQQRERTRLVGTPYVQANLVDAELTRCVSGGRQPFHP